MAKQARTPEYVQKMPQYLEVKEVLEDASERSKTITEEIGNEDAAAHAANVLTVVSKAVKLADKRRLDAGEPYRQSAATINASFKEMMAPLEAVEKRLKKALVDYNARRRREQEEAQRRHEEEVRRAEQAQREAEEKARREAEEAAKRNEPPPPPPEPVQPPPPPPPPPVTAPGVRHTAAGSVSAREEWKFEVFDPARVPAEYKVIDESAIRKAVKGGARDIPGVRIYLAENVHVR